MFSTPEVASFAVRMTVTSERHQLSLPSVPVRTFTTSGGVLSILMSWISVSEVLHALSFALW